MTKKAAQVVGLTASDRGQHHWHREKTTAWIANVFVDPIAVSDVGSCQQ